MTKIDQKPGFGLKTTPQPPLTKKDPPSPLQNRPKPSKTDQNDQNRPPLPPPTPHFTNSEGGITGGTPQGSIPGPLYMDPQIDQNGQN